ncbi:MAG TPA: hypothetical protein DER52_04620, partial [Glaciecola sp.]|nr:hypothetical protein [Glaciecola sp.]
QQHPQLTHSQDMKVTSHVQREKDDWILHTVMLANIDVPFVFKRKKRYQSLQGANVNLTYYPASVMIAGMEMEQMRVVRIKRS